MASFLNFDVGGRPYNSQDFSALQGIVIDATQIYGAFTGDYIINGCTVRGGAGSIWLNGKIRAVDQDQVITNATPFPLYLVEQNTQLNRLYRDGQSKVAFNVFSAVWSTTPPVSGSFIQFNSQNDLTNKTLKKQLEIDAVSTAGGTFTGDITVIDSVRTISAYGSPIGTIMFGSAGPTGNFQTGIGFNHNWNGSNYINYGDGANNMSSAIVMNYTNGAAPVLNFMLNPSSGGSDRFLSNVDVSNSIRMTLNSNGNLNVTGTLISNTVTTNEITVNKVGNNSLIRFPASSNDPGFINHNENNNTAVMTFSVSDDFGDADYFSFGSTPGGNYVEGARINSNGRSTFANSMTVQGNVNAADFIASGNSVTTQINNATNTATTANNNANNALATANTANSAASTAQSTATAAQNTANTANSTANSATNTANTALTVANNNSIPAGIILLWSGSQVNIPSGWVLCNGANGTPDLRDRFVVGAGNSYTVGANGGANSVQLSVLELPSHSHDVNVNDPGHIHALTRLAKPGGDGNGGRWGVDGNGGTFTGSATTGISISIQSTGSNFAHENRPPYWALCYIMKT